MFYILRTVSARSHQRVKGHGRPQDGELNTFTYLTVNFSRHIAHERSEYAKHSVCLLHLQTPIEVHPLILPCTRYCSQMPLIERRPCTAMWEALIVISPRRGV